ncbi:SDR family NAD(P)-dependent oxidoreductase [Saccharothrix luteola]|uniref:SDR family NAD(P)-dependent oxidoreductase n=1 Tax=Saccharothrix luteola TaxID=2893018 RepID=UPI001E436C7F|nr:SDR family oxidoreductase [Saccharothrix luteola]MCC8247344.1 SDR family oxidoreductase [Saccharothrix luteola]
MDTLLTDRVVVVTGAGSGIGLATARKFAEEGARVVGADLDPRPLKDLPGAVLPVTVDMGEESAGDRVVEAAVAEFGAVDVLVNNVGVYPYRENGFLSVDDAEWHRVLNLNFLSAVRMTRAVLPHMIAAGRGALVHIASEGSREPAPFFVDYCVSKAAVLNLSKSLANEFGPQGVRSNVVSPGATRTPAWDAPGGLADRLAAEFEMEKEAALTHFVREVRKLPTGRLGTPDEVASVIVFLGSDLSAQVTGAEYTINGGSYAAA